MLGHTHSKINSLLASMPDFVRERLEAQFELVHFGVGQTIYEPGVRLAYVYFPIDMIAAFIYISKSGVSSEVAIVGNDGMLGVAVCLGGESTPDSAVVLSAGYAYRLKASVLRDQLRGCASLRATLLCYVHALMIQTAVLSACHRHHSIEKQLRCLLLLSMDRLSTNQLVMTHELIANSIGVRREGITAAATALQASGIIAYRRGQITVLDRNMLESACCECYSAAKMAVEVNVQIPLAA